MNADDVLEVINNNKNVTTTHSNSSPTIGTKQTATQKDAAILTMHAVAIKRVTQIFALCSGCSSKSKREAPVSSSVPKSHKQTSTHAYTGMVAFRFVSNVSNQSRSIERTRVVGWLVGWFIGV